MGITVATLKLTMYVGSVSVLSSALMSLRSSEIHFDVGFLEQLGTLISPESYLKPTGR
jgi:hypothetical protein